MKIYLYFCFIVGLVLNGMTVQGQNQTLNNFLQSKGLKYAGVGVKVVDLESGKDVCKHNENLALVPASTLKILTTASAFEILGEKYVYKTSLYSVGNINGVGELSGYLYIEGSGDPTLGSEYMGATDKEAFLKEWLSAIQKAGIKKVKQGICVSNFKESYEPSSVKWIIEDVGNYYAPEIYPVNVFDNTYRLHLKSGKAGTAPEVLKTEPFVNLNFYNYLKAASNNMDSAYIRGIPQSNDRYLYGTIPAGKPDFVIKGTIPKPPLFLADYLKKYLISNGIAVDGDISEVKQPGNNSVKLITTSSKSLYDIIKIVNYRSNNHFAESLFYTIGGNTFDNTYIPKQGAEIIKNFWKKQGIDMSGVFMYDGCGLSPSNAISAGVLTDVLVYMNKKSTSFYQSLPEAGKEGTVINFLKSKNATVQARIKSGSINNVQSYAGYIEKGGKKYAFTIIVNNFTGSRTQLRSQIETFLLNL